jgi:hypothetical protein
MKLTSRIMAQGHTMSISQQENSVLSDRRDREEPGLENARELDARIEPRAAVIVNADDWGRDAATSDRTLDCMLQGAISSVSAMVFMEDSERAADLARQYGIGTGLHLNFTLRYSARNCPRGLMDRQEQIGRFLTSSRPAPIFYHRRLVTSFDYVVKAQLEEYERLYGAAVDRVDGHHHMHLCRNVIAQELLPAGAIVRRNLSFRNGEKGFFNRLYRRRQDQRLARRHPMTDFFFDLQPVAPIERLKEICSLARQFNIEIETHPVRDSEYAFLMSGGLPGCAEQVAVARGYVLRSHGPASGAETPAAHQQEWRISR